MDEYVDSETGEIINGDNTIGTISIEEAVNIMVPMPSHTHPSQDDGTQAVFKDIPCEVSPEDVSRAASWYFHRLKANALKKGYEPEFPE